MFLFCCRLPHSVLQLLPSTWFKTSDSYLTPACSVFLLQSPNYWGPKQLSGTWSHAVHRAPSPWITKAAERSDALHAMLHNPFNKRLLRIRAGKVSKSSCQLISQPCWCFMWRGKFLTCGWQDGLVIGKTVLQVKVQDPSQLQSVWKKVSFIPVRSLNSWRGKGDSSFYFIFFIKGKSTGNVFVTSKW